MDYIDLHVHSNVSDGTLFPKEIVALAAKKGLKAFALTDHDTVLGVEEAIDAANELKKNGIQLEVIPGIELSASYHGQDIHILGLYVDYRDPDFLSILDDIMKEREERNIKMCQNLQNAGINITMDALREDNKDTVITRAHFARFLKEHGYCKTTDDAFKRYLDSSGPYYVSRKYMNPIEAIKLILRAKGIPVLAHPLLYKLPPEELSTLISQLKEAGLVGIETFYSNNMGCDESNVRKLARIHDLVMTGGSDFHGNNKPLIDLGVGKGNLKIPASILDDLAFFHKDC